MKDHIKDANVTLCQTTTKLSLAAHEGYKQGNLAFFVLLTGIIYTLDMLQHQLARLSLFFPRNLQQDHFKNPDQPNITFKYSYRFHYDCGDGYTPTSGLTDSDKSMTRDEALDFANGIGKSKGWGNAVKVVETVKMSREVM